MSNTAIAGWTPAYEWKAIALLSLAFGLVGLDRWIITPLFPFIMADLHLGYGQIGLLAGVLAVAWGVAAILMGRVSDRIGRRPILIPAIVLFSLLAGFCGLAGSFVMLMVLRGMMGVTEGAFTPVSVACAAEASLPRRRGLNQGLQLSLFALIGLGFGPVIATQMLRVVPSWRWVFLVVAVPGFILAVLLAVVIREPRARVETAPMIAAPRAPWLDALTSRNVLLSMLGILCTMCCIFVISAMVPNYLVDYVKLAPTQMGFVMSAIGLGGFAGDFVVPGLSDRLGRKPMAVAGFVIGIVLLRWFAGIGAAPAMLFAALFGLGFCALGLTALFTGPLPTEAVSPALIATAVGLVSGCGEIFGGGLAPAIGGWIAQRYGIAHVLDLATAGLVVGIPVALLLRESAPARVGVARGGAG